MKGANALSIDDPGADLAARVLGVMYSEKIEL